jgi:hypothetical protein
VGIVTCIVTIASGVVVAYAGSLLRDSGADLPTLIFVFLDSNPLEFYVEKDKGKESYH